MHQTVKCCLSREHICSKRQIVNTTAFSLPNLWSVAIWMLILVTCHDYRLEIIISNKFQSSASPFKLKGIKPFICLNLLFLHHHLIFRNNDFYLALYLDHLPILFSNCDLWNIICPLSERFVSLYSIQFLFVILFHDLALLENEVSNSKYRLCLPKFGYRGENTLVSISTSQFMTRCDQPFGLSTYAECWVQNSIYDQQGWLQRGPSLIHLRVQIHSHYAMLTSQPLMRRFLFNSNLVYGRHVSQLHKTPRTFLSKQPPPLDFNYLIKK